MYRYRRQRRSHNMIDFVMPFLILIAVGVILVLLYKLVAAFFEEDSNQAAYMHIEEGSVELKTWGTDNFFNISNDTLIVEGDEVVTSADAKIIVEFFDGTLMRLDGGTDVVFEEIVVDEKEPFVSVLVVDGNAWFNKIYKATAATELDVKMTNIVVNADAESIFEVESGLDDTVRGIGGDDVVIEILDEEGRKAVAEEDVGVGQEVVFSDEAMERFWKFQSPNVLSSIAEDFKGTEWYDWNIREDKSPTEFEKSVGGEQFVRVEPEVIEDEEDDQEGLEEVKPEEIDENAEQTEDSEQGEEEVETAVGKPAVSTVAGSSETNAEGFYISSQNPTVLTGTVPAATTQVIVNGYTLQKFAPGDTTWSYLANADFALIQPGENTFEVYAVGADGMRSEALVIKVLYQPQEVQSEPQAQEEAPVNEEENTPAE